MLDRGGCVPEGGVCHPSGPATREAGAAAGGDVARRRNISTPVHDIF
ncbi:hypothetical protein [Phosphitispora sp. TUW77]